MSLPHRLLLSCPAIALVATLAACGGGATPQAGGPTTPAAAVTSAAPAPAPTPTPADVELTKENWVATITAAQSALDTVSCRFTMTIGAAGQQIDATGAMRAAADGSPEMQMTMAIPGTGTVDMRLVGGLMYMSMGDLTGGMFVQMDPNDPSLGMEMPQDLDPAQDAADLAGAVLSVHKVGEPETVGGTQAQAYDVVVDLSKVSGASKEQLDSLIAEAQTGGVSVPPMVTYHFWVDADGLVRQMSYELMGSSSTVTFDGWGEPVDIQVPSADQIITMDDLAALQTTE